MMIKTAAVCLALLCGTAASAVPTIYTDVTAFNAAISASTTYAFTFAGTEFTGTSYTLGPATFGSDSLQSYNDAYGVPYLGNYGSLLTIDSTTTGLGLNLGSYFGAQTVTYDIGGVIGTLFVPSPDSTTFIGFIDSSPVHVTFTNASELDTVSFVAGGGTVPEPASWALLIAGFGLVGVAARRSRAVAAA